MDNLCRNSSRIWDSFILPIFSSLIIAGFFLTKSKFEDPEFPRTLDALISVLGAEIVEYEDKTQCCGGVILDVDDKIALAMAQKKLDHVNAMGADAMVLMCPLCGSMYDRNQMVIERRSNVAYNLPVLFYPQVLGLALGIDPKGLGLNLNRVKTSDLLSKLSI